MEKYDEESAVSDKAGALLSLGLVEMGEAVMPLFWPLDKEADVVFTVFQGRFGRLFHPSDSEEGSNEPDPDFPSKAVSARFWSSGYTVSSLVLCKDKIEIPRARSINSPSNPLPRLLSPQMLEFQLDFPDPKPLPIPA
jgi:hypothetical protein